MSYDLLDIPILNAHPKLQGVLVYFFRAFTSSVNVGVLAILGITITLALALNNLIFAIIVSSIYGLVQLAITLYVLNLVITSNYLYRIKKYDLVWEIEDQLGNMAFFTLEQDIVLNRMTDTISLFFPLDIYVNEIEVYNFLAKYYGSRKHFLAYLDSFKRAGTLINIRARGRRNVVRKAGNSVIEVAMDYPISELNIIMKFRKTSNVNPEIFMRNGALTTLVDNNNGKCIVSTLNSDNGCLVTCKILEPKFGNSYLVTWRTPS